MCTDVMRRVDVTGTGYANGGSIDVATVVASFVHPRRLPIEHALCVDFRASGDDPSARVSVELDVASARRVAESILEALDAAGVS